MSLHASDGSKVGTLTDGVGSLVTRPTLITGSTKQCKGIHAPDGSRYMCFAEELTSPAGFAFILNGDGAYIINADNSYILAKV